MQSTRLWKSCMYNTTASLDQTCLFVFLFCFFAVCSIEDRAEEKFSKKKKKKTIIQKIQLNRLVMRIHGTIMEYPSQDRQYTYEYTFFFPRQAIIITYKRRFFLTYEYHAKIIWNVNSHHRFVIYASCRGHGLRRPRGLTVSTFGWRIPLNGSARRGGGKQTTK